MGPRPTFASTLSSDSNASDAQWWDHAKKPADYLRMIELFAVDFLASLRIKQNNKQEKVQVKKQQQTMNKQQEEQQHVNKQHEEQKKMQQQKNKQTVNKVREHNDETSVVRYPPGQDELDYVHNNFVVPTDWSDFSDFSEDDEHGGDGEQLRSRT